MSLNIFVLTGLVATSFLAPGALRTFRPQDVLFLRFVFAFTVFYTLSPFYLGLMHSWRSFKTMLGAFPSYYVCNLGPVPIASATTSYAPVPSQLFLPTILSDFFTYSIANYDNWRWGTRESKTDTAEDTAGADIAAEIVARSQRAARSMHQATTSSLVVAQLFLVIFIIVFSVRGIGLSACMLFFPPHTHTRTSLPDCCRESH